MTDWREHNGGPQPVADDVWVEAQWPFAGAHFSGEPDEMEQASELPWEGCNLRYRILNQHLIDAARLEGIRLGLEAAARLAEEESGNLSTTARVLQGFHSQSSATVLLADKGIGSAIRALNPDTIARDVQTSSHQAKCDNLHIAREAVLDQLTSEAQADNMGYDNEPR